MSLQPVPPYSFGQLGATQPFWCRIFCHGMLHFFSVNTEVVRRPASRRSGGRCVSRKARTSSRKARSSGERSRFMRASLAARRGAFQCHAMHDAAEALIVVERIV